MFWGTKQKVEMKAKLTVHEKLERYRYLLFGKVLNQTGFDWEKQFQPVQNPDEMLQTIHRQNQDQVHTATKIPFDVFPLFRELHGLSPNFHIYVSVSDLYIPHISCSRVGRSMVGIYKSLTDTWMWKFGLWPRNSFSGKFCSEFSVLVLCSAYKN